MEHDVVAGVFGKIFVLLANDEENLEHNKVLAKEIWTLIPDYGFELFLMGCNDSLIKLGLADYYNDVLFYNVNRSD